MAEEVNVPKVGKLKKQYVYVGIGGATLYVLYRYYTASKAAKEAANAEPIVDQATVDQAALNGGGIVPTGGGAYNYGGSAPSGSYTGPPASTIVTNADWTNAAIAYLVNNGYDSKASAAALGSFLARQPLNGDQTVIVRAAVAGVGNPPSGSFQVIPTPKPSSPPTVPNPTVPTGLHRGTLTKSAVSIFWNTAAHNTKYSLYRNGSKIATQQGNYHTDSGLRANTTYHYQVSAYNSAGKESAKSSTLTVKTPKK